MVRLRCRNCSSGVIQAVSAQIRDENLQGRNRSIQSCQSDPHKRCAGKKQRPKLKFPTTVGTSQHTHQMPTIPRKTTPNRCAPTKLTARLDWLFQRDRLQRHLPMNTYKQTIHNRPTTHSTKTRSLVASNFECLVHRQDVYRKHMRIVTCFIVTCAQATQH